MKTYIIALFLLCSGAAAFSQRVASSCTGPESLLNLYREDAAKIAFIYAIKKDSSYLDSLNISQSLQDTILNALIAVYNSGTLAAKSATGRVYFYNPVNEIWGMIFVDQNYYSLTRIALKLDTSLQWQKRLYMLQSQTGLNAVDSFLSVMKLKIDTSGDKYYADAWLVTDTFRNTFLIAKKWNEITSNSTNAQPDNYNYPWEGGGNITPVFSDSNIMLNYVLGWGDCPSGCAFREYWNFTVYPDCSVFAGSWGGDAGPPSIVKNEVEETIKIIIYPNPATQAITIETVPQSKIQIIGVTGNILSSTNSQSDQEEIDISKLPKGIYLIRATDKQGYIRTAKFVKE